MDNQTALVSLAGDGAQTPFDRPVMWPVNSSQAYSDARNIRFSPMQK